MYIYLYRPTIKMCSFKNCSHEDSLGNAKWFDDIAVKYPSEFIF